MRRFLLAAAVLPFIAGVAYAQPRPTQTVTTVPGRVATYSASVTALTPAASATDFFTITGSATAIIRVKEVGCWGTSTADGTSPVDIVRRSTADTVGTSTTRANIPYDSADVAGTATVLAYTANPTVGTLVGGAGATVRSFPLRTSVAATSGNTSVAASLFNYPDLEKEIVLRGVTQVLALNGRGASFVAGASLNCFVVWTESGS